jgi:hypothetical protein
MEISFTTKFVNLDCSKVDCWKVLKQTIFTCPSSLCKRTTFERSILVSLSISCLLKQKKYEYMVLELNEKKKYNQIQGCDHGQTSRKPCWMTKKLQFFQTIYVMPL